MFVVTVLPDQVELLAHDGETILGATIRDGYRYRFGCRRGGCGECKVDLISGEVAYERPVAKQVLSDEERGQGVCLSCRAVPVTDTVIRLRGGQDLQPMSGLARLIAEQELKRARRQPI